jgi:hypothetical protein
MGGGDSSRRGDLTVSGDSHREPIPDEPLSIAAATGSAATAVAAAVAVAVDSLCHIFPDESFGVLPFVGDVRLGGVDAADESEDGDVEEGVSGRRDDGDDSSGERKDMSRSSFKQRNPMTLRTPPRPILGTTRLSTPSTFGFIVVWHDIYIYNYTIRVSILALLSFGLGMVYSIRFHNTY